MSGGITATSFATYAGLALTAASTVAGIAGQAQQAGAQQAQAGYQAAVMRNNALAAEALAKNAEKRGAIAEQAQRNKTAQMLGRQTAMLAGQGTDFSGSELNVLGDTAAAGEQDALSLRYNSALEAWGYRNKAAEATAAANAPGPGGLSALSVGSSLIGGATKVADTWYRYQQGQPKQDASSDFFNRGLPSGYYDGTANA